MLKNLMLSSGEWTIVFMLEHHYSANILVVETVRKLYLLYLSEVPVV